MGIMVDADLVLVNGNVFTMDDKKPRAEGVAIKDGRFLWVGKNNEVKGAIGKETQLRDLKGMTVTPGFIESHNHTLDFGLGLGGINLNAVDSIQDMLSLLEQRTKKQEEGTWISAVGFNQNELKEKRHPNRNDLDKVAPRHPVALKHTSGHALVVNSMALSLAGITRNTQDPVGAKIGKDKDTGEPTGVLFELNAIKLIEDIIPKPSYNQLITGLRMANEQFLSEGVTSATDAGIGLLEAPHQIAAFQEAIEKGDLKVRHNLAILGEALVDYAHIDEGLMDIEWKLLGMGIRSGLGDERLRIGPFKIVLDGAVSTVTAATYEPYGVDPGERGTGLLIIEPEKVKKIVSAIHRLGWQLAIHGVGDRALDVAIDALGEALQAKPVNDPRPRIEHCTMVVPRMLGKIKQLGAIAVLQPAFLWQLGDNWIYQLGKERASKFKPFKTLLQKGVRVAFSSDRPVVNGAPLLGIHAAVNQKTMGGQDYAPNEKISPEEALHCYTLNGAYATFEEKIKGSIEVGKLADLVVLAEDLTQVEPRRIQDITVIATVVGGEFCYEKK
ncbi:MAG: amidohydrolase [Thermodesulfobacteriota bacterium]